MSLQELRRQRAIRRAKEAPFPNFRDDNTLVAPELRLVARDIPGINEAFVIWPAARAGWPFQHPVDDDNDLFLELSRAAFDAVPKGRIRTNDIPNANDLEDRPEICERLGIHFDMIAPRESVYFHMGALSGLVKIGIATNPRERLCNQQCGSGERIFRLGALPGSRDLERLYHERFRPARAHGEWFHPHPDILSFALSGLW